MTTVDSDAINKLVTALRGELSRSHNKVKLEKKLLADSPDQSRSSSSDSISAKALGVKDGKDVNKLFDQLDLDGDGFLSLGDIISGIRRKAKETGGNGNEKQVGTDPRT